MDLKTGLVQSTSSVMMIVKSIYQLSEIDQMRTLKLATKLKGI